MIERLGDYIANQDYGNVVHKADISIVWRILSKIRHATAVWMLHR